MVQRPFDSWESRFVKIWTVCNLQDEHDMTVTGRDRHDPRKAILSLVFYTKTKLSIAFGRLGYIYILVVSTIFPSVSPNHPMASWFSPSTFSLGRGFRFQLLGHVALFPGAGHLDGDITWENPEAPDFYGDFMMILCWSYGDLMVIYQINHDEYIYIYQ